jgi:hypothetical protein
MANELIQSLRGILRSPGFAVLSILTLALGIGTAASRERTSRYQLQEGQPKRGKTV